MRLPNTLKNGQTNKQVQAIVEAWNHSNFPYKKLYPQWFGQHII